MAKFKNKTDTAEQLFNRYERANNRMLLQESRLQDCYDLSFPNRANFRGNVPGEQRNLRIYDNTAPDGVMQFANDIQSILMPPFQRWMTLIPGHEVPDALKAGVTEELQDATEIFFRYLNQSNFSQASAESFGDLAISTGILILEEGTQDNPLIFRSVAISEVAFSEGRHGKIDNYWRKFEISFRDAMLKWPALKLSTNQRYQFDKNPDEKLTLIEGTVLVPGKEEEDDEYQYYIQDNDKKKLMLEEQRDWNPWTGFRAAKTTGEVIGYGPVMRLLPTIRALNKMVEWDLRSFKFAALGVMMVENSGVLNPFTTTIEPGSIIPVEPSVSGKDPIRPIQLGGQPQITIEKIQAMQQIITKALSSRPLPPDIKPGVTKFEIATRLQEWVRNNGAAFGRVSVELQDPVIIKSFNILTKKKIIKIPGFKIDRNKVNIEYQSPLITIQNEQDVQALQEASSSIASAFGAEGLSVAYKMPEVNEYINTKLGVPAKLINSAAEMQKQLESIQQQQQQDQQQQEQSQLPPEQVQQPQLPLAAQAPSPQ